MSADFLKRLEELSEAFEELISDGMSFDEVIAVVGGIYQVAKELPGDSSARKILVMAGWKWADNKWKIIDRANAKINLPIIGEKTEAKLLRGLVESVVIPAITSGIKLNGNKLMKL